MIWRPSHRFHTPARLLADRHYNRQKIGSPQFMPAGSCRVLIAANQKAVFGLSYPKAEFVKHAWAGAWINSIFRNEQAGPLASTMIRDAIAIMQTLYDVPPLGCVTFVDPKKVRGEMRRAARGYSASAICWPGSGTSASRKRACGRGSCCPLTCRHRSRWFRHERPRKVEGRMIIVSVTLHSARDGSKTELARMEICNDETGTAMRRNYIGRVLRGRSTEQLDRREVHRTGEVKNWPAERAHVWNLVAAMLKSMAYGATNGRFFNA